MAFGMDSGKLGACIVISASLFSFTVLFLDFTLYPMDKTRLALLGRFAGLLSGTGSDKYSRQ